MSRFTIELRPGEGGRDAEAFSLELRQALFALARHRGDRARAITRESGNRTLYMRIEGNLDVYRVLAGVHRIQRIPANDKRGRRHTSTATVAILEDRDTYGIELKGEELTMQSYRGSGPGGQHRNKSATAVRLVHKPTGLVVTAEDSRSQRTNLQSAKTKLESLLTERHRQETKQQVILERNGQISSAERPAKGWTHNAQRGEVVCHKTGHHWSWPDFYEGRIDRAWSGRSRS